MSKLLPLEALARTPQPGPPGLDLASPNPILGKTVFVRLPVAAEWRCEVEACKLEAERSIVLRDRMWVRRGKARFTAVHSSGARFKVSVEIRPWTAPARSDSRTAQVLAPSCPKARDERKVWRSIFRCLLPASEKRVRIRCHYTERQIEIRWRPGGAKDAAGDFERLIAACECH